MVVGDIPLITSEPTNLLAVRALLALRHTNASKQLFPGGKVEMRTFVEVDERGTRAAVATAVGVGIVSFSGFVVDRPFVFVIRERLSGTILFVGLVSDPTATDSGAGRLVSDCTGATLP